MRKPRRSARARQRGIALLTAFFVVTLATIAAVALVSSTSISIRRAESLQDSERAWWYAQGAESWVKSVLVEDGRNNKTDYLGEAWAQPVSFLPIDDGGIRGQVIDLQSRFNLNALASLPTTAVGANGVTGASNVSGQALAAQTRETEAKLEQRQLQFQRLLANLDGVEGVNVDGLGTAIRDWADTDDERSGTSGAEDGDYLALDIPYRAANQPFQSTSELLAVRGMTAPLYDQLRQYVSALPAQTPINVNTAPLAVLLSLSDKIDKQQMTSLIQNRVKQPIDSVQSLFSQGTGIFPADVTQDQLSVNTNYFLLQQQVAVGRARIALYSVIYRPGGGGTPFVLAHHTDTE